MAIRNIRMIGDDILTKKCKVVKEMTEKNKELIADMFDTMVMSAITWGSSAGAKPIKEEIYFFKLLGSFSEVAVFPPIRKPATAAFFPLPSATTCSKI